MKEKKGNAIEDMRKMIVFFNEKWDGFKPLYKLFSTDKEKLVYDTGTNKILSCEDGAYFFLEAYQKNDFNKALAEMKQMYSESAIANSLLIIKNAIETEGVLQTDSRKIKMKDQVFERVTELGKEYLPMITLEVTSRCNLRCIYCIYNEPVKYARNHGPAEMTWDIARKSIDLLAANSKKAKELFVTFYGGEPLLNLKLIKKSVPYAQECFKGRPLHFSLTTNCTLINENTARFFAENNFSILASIDGPPDIHNSYRINTQGRGSFDNSMKGLQMLVDIYGNEKNSKIALNMVFAPPFSEEKINRISQFLQENSYLANLRAHITYAVAGTIPAEKMAENKAYENDKNLFEWAEEQFLNQYPHGNKTFLSKDTIEKSMYKLYSRHISDEPVYQLYPNGCCNPAVRKVFIEADGKIRLCERIYSTAPTIGDVEKGIDYDLVKRVFVDEYIEMSNRDCAKCWVGRLCSLCYVDAYENKKFSYEKKRNMCRIIRHLVERDLKLYARLIKIDPEGLNYLGDYKIM